MVPTDAASGRAPRFGAMTRRLGFPGERPAPLIGAFAVGTVTVNGSPLGPGPPGGQRFLNLSPGVSESRASLARTSGPITAVPGRKARHRPVNKTLKTQ